MAAATGVSDATVGRIWRAHGLKPHLTRTFKTNSGDIDIDYAITTQGPIRRNRLQGQVNGGGVEIQLRTSSGSVTIE